MINSNLLEEAKKRIDLLNYIENATNTKAKKIGNAYFINPCPFCGHKNHFAINRDEMYFNSFSSNTNCNSGGSIVDFIMLYDNINKADAIAKVIEIAGLSNSAELPKKTNYTKTKTILKNSEGDIKTMETKHNADFTELIEKLHKNVGDTDYFINRGLTNSTIQKYKLGYAEEGFNTAIAECKILTENKSNVYSAYKYFLPIWDADEVCRYFITRLDDTSVPDGYDKVQKTHNLKGFPVSLFNEKYLLSRSNEVDTIFIVEGIFDALSIEEIGLKSIALNSTSNANLLLQKIKEHKDKLLDKLFVLVPDNDTAGRELKEKLSKEFIDLGLCFVVCELPQKFKDANEFLKEDRKEFTNYISGFLQKVRTSDYNIAYLNKFLDEINKSKDAGVINTGFSGFNLILGGGLFSGLYVIGAISSLGKTTFVSQIADFLASSGVDVLYYSLEMGRNDMLRKSISREMFMIDPLNASSSRDIRMGQHNKSIFTIAFEKYQNYSSNISTIEGGFNVGVHEIREKIKRNISLRGKKPVVIIDYLQILKPCSIKMSDKQATDYNVSELKKISRDFDISIIAISSLNRMNYTSAIGFESFKESGAIEYSSDVVIGLQLKRTNEIALLKTETEKREMVSELKMKNPRDIELVIIKQRDGSAYGKQDFSYYPKFNCFMET